MHFKLELILRRGFGKEFDLQVEDAGLPVLAISFSHISDGKDKRLGNSLCIVVTQIIPPPRIEELLQSVPKPVPKSLLDFADDVERRLEDAATKALKLLRWYCGSSEGHNPMGASKGLAYSSDAMHWRKLPRTISANITFGIPELMMTAEVATSVADLWRRGSQQPLAHELFREAAEQQSENPRSCLILGVAAAEVGFKQLVGSLVPDAKWLADNAPSPRS